MQIGLGGEPSTQATLFSDSGDMVSLFIDLRPILMG
jgi:hypothetical protein